MEPEPLHVFRLQLQKCRYFVVKYIVKSLDDHLAAHDPEHIEPPKGIHGDNPFVGEFGWIAYLKNR